MVVQCIGLLVRWSLKDLLGAFSWICSTYASILYVAEDEMGIRLKEIEMFLLDFFDCFLHGDVGGLFEGVDFCSFFFEIY